MKKPKIEYYWTRAYDEVNHFVNWRLVGANGEIMCQSTQGFRDKVDAQRSVESVAFALNGAGIDDLPCFRFFREVGPGRKPK